MAPLPSLLRGARGSSYPVGTLVAAALVAILALLPLGFIVGYTISTGWAETQRLIFRPRTAELLWNTVRLTGGCVLLCAVLGTGAAWLVERSTLPGRRIWHVLLVAPLAIPAFVNSYGWVSLLPGASGYLGALLIVTLSYFPLVYLPVVATLRGLDPALEETSYALGHGCLRTFVSVVLPQLRPALLGGCLLVSLHLLAEFGALQMLRFPTFTTAIYDQFQSSYNGPAANMLAAVLVLCCLLLLVAELRLRGRARYARVGAGAARPAIRLRLRGWTAPVLAGLGALIALALAVPVGSLVFWLVTGRSANVTLADLLTAAGSSLGLGAVAAVCTVVFAIPVAWLYVRHSGWPATMLERSTYFGNALPGIVVALALVTIGVHAFPALYQTTSLLIAAYVILFLPRAVVNVRAALAQAPPVLDDVAHSLGLSRTATLRRVTLPLIAPGLGAGAALVFIAVVTELTATLLLAPTGTQTLATQFWSYSDSVAYGAAAPYAAVMVVLSAPATFLLTRESTRTTRP
ncbi:ABC transporter permease [Amycolatopsis taiwanensis]|uniref:Iron ABC transporter permease n=1 Tax=Amycolatopsis taiwanensis TaxID=342230 RepID=A0A9W6VEX1_9PSEU|nr:iron ABC transporter permease [Amycolatopsis taiwanensis]GLY64897.1 iron ABC transporter permease [Amycolatopsis taiwanensis]